MQWSINGLDVLNEGDLSNVVVLSRFQISDTQDGLQGAVNYGVNLLPPSGTFTPFDQITQAQAIQWTQEALGPDRVASMEAEVQAQIDAQKIPTPQPAPLPWDQQQA
jgi:hypothetical protein